MILLLAVNSIIIKLEGITAHAGEPEGDQPAMAIASITNSILLFKLTFLKKMPDYSYLYYGKKPTGSWRNSFTVRSE
jgi:hypothetical protein